MNLDLFIEKKVTVAAAAETAYSFSTRTSGPPSCTNPGWTVPGCELSCVVLHETSQG